MALNSEFIREEINKGIKAHKAGDKQAAHLHFQKALREDAANIAALLWLAYITSDFDKQLFLLDRVLQLDPENERAKRGKQWVKRKMDRAKEPSGELSDEPSDANQKARAQASQASQASIEDETFAGISLNTLKDRIGADDLREQAKKGTVAQRARRRVSPLFLIFFLGFILIGLGVWRLAFFNSSISLAALAPSATPTPAFALETNAPPTPPLSATDAPLPAALPLPTEPALSLALSVAEVETEATPLPPTPSSPPLAYQPQSPDEKWIEIDVSDQQLIAWEGEKPVMHFSVSTGRPNTPTLLGKFRIYEKLVSTRMTGPGYDLPGVPHIMYFHGAYALHGAYWHNNFGQPMSHGCVNLSLPDAETLFNWAEPILPEGLAYMNATDDNPGTLVVAHQ